MGARNPLRGIGRLTAGWVFAAALAGTAFAVSNPSTSGYARLLHGPMLGAVTPASISIWVRLSGPDEVQVEYAPAATPKSAATRRTPPQRARKEDDYTVVVTVRDLAPGTSYRYRALVAGAPDLNQAPAGFFEARTAPAPGAPGQFSVAFGSCARVERHPVQPIWTALHARRPDLMLWLGDNVYADTLDPEIMAECYQRQRAVPELQPFLRTTPQLAIWDDHDYGLNDSDGSHPGKVEALGVFRRYWANPAYGLPEAPGVFCAFHYGGVDFFMVDNRYHRAPAASPDVLGKSTLGTAQKDWLKAGLRASRAPFKIVASGQPWNNQKGPGGESWEAFAHERAELLAFIRAEGISGVVLLSGDNHIGELNCLPESERGGYDLFEVSSSPLAQDPSVSWLNYRTIPRIRQVYFGGPNFGLLDFDLSATDPTLTVTLHDASGNSVWSALVLRASELRNGVSVWREKMDGTSRRRWDRALAGEAYYDAPRGPAP
jgi:alkaline phosphatase D